MDLRDFVIQTMERTRKRTLDAVGGLTDAQLRWRAGPDANHIGFLLWHILRAEDRYTHRWLSQRGEVWHNQGYAARHKLPVQPPDRDSPLNSGNSWTSQQVGDFQVPPLKDLLTYAETVRKGSLEVIRGVDLKRLDDRPNPKQPDMTITRYLQNCFSHEIEHQAQIEFILGLMKSKG